MKKNNYLDPKYKTLRAFDKEIREKIYFYKVLLGTGIKKENQEEAKKHFSEYLKAHILYTKFYIQQIEFLDMCFRDFLKPEQDRQAGFRKEKPEGEDKNA